MEKDNAIVTHAIELTEGERVDVLETTIKHDELTAKHLIYVYKKDNGYIYCMLFGKYGLYAYDRDTLIGLIDIILTNTSMKSQSFYD